MRKSALDASDRRRAALAARRNNQTPPPIIAMTKRVTSRLFFIGWRSDGSQVFLHTQQALRLAPDCVDWPEGQRIELSLKSKKQKVIT